MSTDKDTWLITGAGGFVGQALASTLLNEDLVSRLILVDLQEPPVPKATGRDASVTSISADLTSQPTIEATFKPELTCIYLLHGIMSSQAEGDLDLGLKVNIDSNRLILDHLRKTNPGVTVVFTSSTAVYGPPAGPDSILSETTAADPQSSYGAQKHIAETLVNDYSRRGLLDGRVVRLPTVGLSSLMTFCSLFPHFLHRTSYSKFMIDRSLSGQVNPLALHHPSHLASSESR